MSYRNATRERAAQLAAAVLKKRLGVNPDDQPIGLVLGTGWGDVLPVDGVQRCSFRDILGFRKLETLEGHAREAVSGQVAGKPVLALRGRVHLNEAPCDQNIAKMVRLQIEMLMQCGVRTLILTSAVGALPRPVSRLFRVGEVCVVNGFVTLFAPDMPLWAGEFCSPEDTLDPALQSIAMKMSKDVGGGTAGHVMVRGPFFEGRKYDKEYLSRTGASVVGMSMLPEACIAALYGARVLGLGFVTNDAVEEHSHEENLARANVAREKLGAYLTRIIAAI